MGDEREGLFNHMIEGYLMPLELAIPNCPSAGRGLGAAVAGSDVLPGGLPVPNVPLLLFPQYLPCLPPLTPEQPEGPFQNSNLNVIHIS